MNFSPKLKKARREIEEIAKKYDIAISCTLHTPNFSENFYRINPTYSCAFFEGDLLRMKTTGLGLNQSQKKKLIEETTNMILMLGIAQGNNALNFQKIKRVIESKFSIEIFDEGFTSDKSIDN